MSEHMMPIPSRLYNAAVGGHVAGADQIIDDETGLTLDKVTGGALEEKTYTSGSYSGMGRVVLRKNLVEGVNTLNQSMINQQNTIYIIQYDFTLGENITVPANCVLKFDGGSISGAYVLTFNDTLLTGKPNIALSTICDGSVKNKELHVEWFGAVGDGTYDSTNGAQGTDNRPAFVNISNVINASNGGTIVFGEGKLYAASVERWLKTGALINKGASVFYLYDIAYANIKMNGSSILLKTNINNGYSIINLIGVKNAVIENGNIVGDGETKQYVSYHPDNHPEDTDDSYEWCYGIDIDGSIVEIKNMNIRHCCGDAVIGGSVADWGSPMHRNEDGAVVIKDSELSYCGRQGFSGHSTLYTTLDNVHIHHIGTYGNNPGFAPMAGIDLEYEDQVKTLGIVTIKNCHIHDTSGFSIATGKSGNELSQVKSMLVDNCCFDNGISTGNIEATEGEMVFSNCEIKNASRLDGGIILYNCNVIIPSNSPRNYLYLSFKEFVGGRLINEKSAGSIQVHTFDEVGFNNIFRNSVIKGFKNEDSNQNYKCFNAYNSSHPLVLSFYDCDVVDCDFWISETFATKTNVFKDTFFDNCFICINNKSLFYNCVLKNCLSSKEKASSIITFDNCSIENDVALPTNSRYGWPIIPSCIEGSENRFCNNIFSVRPVRSSDTWTTSITAQYTRSIVKYTGSTSLDLTFTNVTDCTTSGLS